MTAALAVVGGGLIGCFAAHLVARSHPDRRVLLIERSEIGAGATGWSAGVSFPLAATPGHRPLVRASASLYSRLWNTAAGRFLRPLRMVYVVGPDSAARLRDRVVDAPLRAVHADERRQVERMLPGVRIGPDEQLVTHDEPGFAVDARGLAQWLVSDDVTVHRGHQVAGVEPVDGGYRVIADQAEWRAESVVVATGPWAGPIPDGTTRTKQVSALHTEIPTEPGDPLVYFLDDDLFFLPTGPGEALVSFYRDVWDVDPASMTGAASAADLRAGTAAVDRRCPAAVVTGGRTFCDAYAPDRLPVVTAHGGHLVSISGGSGSGVRLAPGLAAAALHGTNTPIPSDWTAETVRVAASG